MEKGKSCRKTDRIRRNLCQIEWRLVFPSRIPVQGECKQRKKAGYTERLLVKRTLAGGYRHGASSSMQPRWTNPARGKPTSNRPKFSPDESSTSLCRDREELTVVQSQRRDVIFIRKNKQGHKTDCQDAPIQKTRMED